MEKIIKLLLLTVVFLLVIGSCVSAENIRIGGIAADPRVEFYTKVAEGMKDSADELGVEITIQYSNNDIQEELRLAEFFISQNCNGIAVSAIDSIAITGVLNAGKKAGIPIGTIDAEPEELDLSSVVVISDNYAGGFSAAKLMREFLNNEGNILMTEWLFNCKALDDRIRGFREGLKGSNIKIVGTIQQDGTREDTLAKITPLLAKFPDDLSGIFCSQGDPAMGALAAVKAAGREDEITILSYDVESEVAAAIKQGSALKAGVTQFPYELGRRTVAELVKLIKADKRERSERLILVPVLPVVADNVDLLIESSVKFLDKYSNYYKDLQK